MTEIWEFKTTSVHSIKDSTAELDKHINAIAEDGWINYTVAFNEHGIITRFFWKRPKE